MSIAGTVTSGATTITGQVDDLQLPLEAYLMQYAVVTDDAVLTFMNAIQDLLYAIKELTPAMVNYLLDPNDYQSSYVSTLLTQLSNTVYNNILTATTGLDTSVETAMIERARSRILYDANRAARRITTELAAKLPYSGQIGDALIESDRDVAAKLNDINNDILVKQADLTYQMNRDKIKEALETERLNMENFYRNKELHLKAEDSYDERNVLQQWRYYEYLLNRAVQGSRAMIDYVTNIANATDQLTFKNFLEMSKLLADGQLKISQMVANLTP